MWDDWHALWTVRLAQLAEHGVVLDPTTIPLHPQPVATDDAEWDFHHMATVYLPEPGHFWLAWAGSHPIGMIGAQAIGSWVELRRMFVDPAYRRRGVGSRLVHTLLDHCRQQHVTAIELWTGPHGSGEALYTRCGFQRVPRPGSDAAHIQRMTNYCPDHDEIRMRVDWPSINR
jgi:GNAT superfamily N-acetyltransferase